MDILYFAAVPIEKTTISILKFLSQRHGQQYTAQVTMSQVYAVLTHNKYLINQVQNSFLSVKKKTSSGNKYMKSDLYMKKSSFSYYQEKLVLLRKLSALCISKSIRWYPSSARAYQDPVKGKKKGKEKKEKKGLKCTGDLLLPTANRYIDLENITSHLEFGLRHTLFLQFSCSQI